MRGRSFKKAGALLFVLLLAVVVGCQSIGGLNLNEMLIKQLDVKEQEQSQSFQLELEFNDELLAKEDQEITSLLKAIQKLSLNITHSKVDDKGNQWVTGVLRLSKGIFLSRCTRMAKRSDSMSKAPKGRLSWSFPSLDRYSAQVRD